MINKVKFSITLLALISFILFTSYIISTNILAQTEESQVSNEIHVTKTAMNTLHIKDFSTSYVGTFDTIYTINAHPNVLKDSKNILISSITSDFEKSPTIGYIKVSSLENSNNVTAIEMGNPFVDSEQIKKKINTVLSEVIDKSVESGLNYNEIQCNFGMILEEFRCNNYKG